MPGAVILSAFRTARAAAGGRLAAIHPTDLLALLLAGTIERSGVEAKELDDVVIGCVTQAGEQALNIARNAVLSAGFPIEVPGTTVNRFCGSGLQAVNFAAHQIQAGQAELVIG